MNWFSGSGKKGYDSSGTEGNVTQAKRSVLNVVIFCAYVILGKSGHFKTPGICIKIPVRINPDKIK